MRIKLYIGDSQEIVRYGLKAIIRELDPSGIEVVGEGADGLEIYEESRRKKAHVYLINIELPGLNGIDIIPKLRKRAPQSSIIIMSSWYDRSLLESTFMRGAKGFLLKECHGREIINAIHETYAGKHYLSSEISSEVLPPIVAKLYNGNRHARSAGLTQRQREILKLICDGLTEREIGDKLSISYHTVHVHTTNIMKSLDLHTKAELIMYGIREKIIPVHIPA